MTGNYANLTLCKTGETKGKARSNKSVDMKAINEWVKEVWLNAGSLNAGRWQEAKEIKYGTEKLRRTHYKQGNWEIKSKQDRNKLSTTNK